MGTLPRTERLRNRDDIGRLFSEGGSGVSGGILVKALPLPEGGGQVVIVAGKKLGNAVVRNRLKRRLRAAYRQEKDTLAEGWMLALVARRGLLEAKWQDVTRDLQQAVKRAITQTATRTSLSTGDDPTGRQRQQRRR